MQPFDFGGEGLRQQLRIDLFGNVGRAVPKQTACNCNCQSVINGEHGKGVSDRVK